MSKKDLTKPRKIKKPKDSGTSSQEAREAAESIESYYFWTWLAPFIKTYKTKIDVSVKVVLN